jgi:hypothetical protein
MKIYQPGTHGSRTAFVQPGAKFRNVDWLDENGHPKMFSVDFVEGVADVDDRIGQYMIDHDLAKSSPIITL